VKRSIFIMVAAVGALALPASASAQTTYTNNCGYAQDQATHATVANFTVYVEVGSAGMSGQGAAAAGACADGLKSPNNPTNVDGGALEAGTNGGTGDYVIIDGDNDTTDPTGQGDGYFGVSTFETGGKGTCSGGGSGTNSGGCVGIDGVPVTAPLPIACGNTSGNTWANTTRDGCSIP
jgi:hypothetical protein